MSIFFPKLSFEESRLSREAGGKSLALGKNSYFYSTIISRKIKKGRSSRPPLQMPIITMCLPGTLGNMDVKIRMLLPGISQIESAWTKGNFAQFCILARLRDYTIYNFALPFLSSLITTQGIA
ncbi:MAG: hypothetical protein A3J76_04340 [Candidatus Moranbacteria bacterium RBG_13_45_13]|nr:MAG: hypothetical protein A3J76_04340 [Candidatus Moranbacteria bacterium RBG_13_45_13]